MLSLFKGDNYPIQSIILYAEIIWHYYLKKKTAKEIHSNQERHRNGNDLTNIRGFLSIIIPL